MDPALFSPGDGHHVAAAATGRNRVLVADDEDDIRRLVSLAVRKAGCEVVASAAEGAAALAAARAYLAKPFTVAGLVQQVRALTAREPVA